MLKKVVNIEAITSGDPYLEDGIYIPKYQLLDFVMHQSKSEAIIEFQTYRIVVPLSRIVPDDFFKDWIEMSGMVDVNYDDWLKEAK